MHDECYQLDTPTLAILSLPNGERIPVTVPRGALVMVIDGTLSGKRTVAEWNGQKIMMFTDDLLDRGRLLDYAAVSHVC
jgi:hypothetical protein